MNNNITDRVIDELTSNLAEYLDDIILKYLFTTTTGIAILIITVIIVLGMIIISSQLGKIAKNQEVIFAQLKEQMTTQNGIGNTIQRIEYKYQNQHQNQYQYQRTNYNPQQNIQNFQNRL